MPTTLTGTTIGVDGGRVTTLQPENYSTAQSVTIVNGPAHGRVTVNPDNSIALVLTDEVEYSGPLSFTYEIRDASGGVTQETVNLSVAATTQAEGWGTGEHHYMLETDAAGDLIIETGDNHRDVYVSGSSDALGLADIAAREGIPVWSVNATWLADNPQYGGSPELALDEEAGMMLWQGITNAANGPVSHWLHFERGYTYDNLGTTNLVARGVSGEDPLHPIVITSYGDGEQPLLTGSINMFPLYVENIVFTDLHMESQVQALYGQNMIFDNITGTGRFYINAQDFDSITVRNSNFHDIHEDLPEGATEWDAGRDRSTAIFVANSEGLLLENNLFATIGWERDYDPGGDGSGGQPPSLLSHAVYLQSFLTDTTVRDNVFAEGASYGIQVRGGGYLEDNLFIENNAGVNFLGGDYQGFGPVGNFTLFTGNVVTSAAYKEANLIGANALGILNNGEDSTLLNNIVAHLADPNDPNDLLNKPYNYGSIRNEKDPFYDDTIIYKWYSYQDINIFGDPADYDKNIEGLDRATLDAASANNLAKYILKDSNANVTDLIDALKENPIEADILNNFFQTAFGIDLAERANAETLRFIPNELGDGVRWDNRINWDSEDLPGTFAFDSVDLGGNHVFFGGMTTQIRNLDLGPDGLLEVHSGMLRATGTLDAGGTEAGVLVAGAGQMWVNGTASGAAPITVTVTGGRFSNTGVVDGDVDLDVSGGQVLFGNNGDLFNLDGNDSLTITGSTAKLGFDGAGNGTATLSFEAGADLTFVADAGGFASISEFRSGAFGETVAVASKIDLGQLDLNVDFSALVAQGAGMSFTLLQADELVGTLGSVNVTGLSAGLSANFAIDYSTDTLTVTLANGSGVTTTVNGDVAAAPQPEPEPEPVEVVEEPAPTPEPVEVVEEPAPTPEPVEVVEEPAPAPEPVEVVEEPAPAPEPVEVVEEPAPAPEPVEVVADPAPAPAPAPVPAPAPTEPVFTEGQAVAPNQMPEFSSITAEEGEGLVITLQDSAEFFGVFRNAVGSYTVDEQGNIDDVRMLFEDSFSDRGSSVTLTDVDAGEHLHFFMVANGAAWGRSLGEDAQLSFLDTEDGRKILVNGETVQHEPIFFSDSADANADSLQHMMTYQHEDHVVVGFEDMLGGGDMDFNDLGLVIQSTSLEV